MTAPDCTDAVAAWVATWTSAWPAKDSAAVAALYAPTARFQSQPFRPQAEGPQGVLGYLDRVFAEESLVRHWFAAPIVHGDTAAVQYWAVSHTGNGEPVTLAGCAVLRFDADGRCVSHMEYWCEEPGHREPPPGWG